MDGIVLSAAQHSLPLCALIGTDTLLDSESSLLAALEVQIGIVVEAMIWTAPYSESESELKINRCECF
jgi:hypothetical protein